MSDVYFWVINLKKMEQEREDHLVLEIKEKFSGYANSKDDAGLPLHLSSIIWALNLTKIQALRLMKSELGISAVPLKKMVLQWSGRDLNS